MAAHSATLAGMTTQHLGQEVRRRRLETGITLRGLAARLGISPAHLSDIEHNRRRPSEKLLQKIAHELRSVGTTFAALELLVTGLDRETREWAASTPGARAVLRRVLESGQSPAAVLRALDKAFGHKTAAAAKSRKPVRAVRTRKG
ncbi:MAG: helix-turn-helix domain-containing protein [Candidatus Krumholzibacteriia bacterium]